MSRRTQSGVAVAPVVVSTLAARHGLLLLRAMPPDSIHTDRKRAWVMLARVRDYVAIVGSVLVAAYLLAWLLH